MVEILFFVLFLMVISLAFGYIAGFASGRVSERNKLTEILDEYYQLKKGR